MMIVAIILRFVIVCYPDNKQSKHSNCTVTLLEYLEENQEKHLHHHYQPHFTDFFDHH